MIDNEMLLKALLDIKRQEIVLSKFNPQTENIFGDAYTYAMSKKLCPILHNEQEYDPFEEAYMIKRDFVTSVANYCDNLWLNKQNPTYYQIERHFGHDKKSELNAILRYLFINNSFDLDFFNDLKKDCSAHIHYIDKPFDKNSDLTLY